MHACAASCACVLFVFAGRLLTNPCMQLLWREYCDGDAVTTGTFLVAVQRFLEQKLHMGEREVAAALDDANKAALTRFLDQRKARDGKVGGWVGEGGLEWKEMRLDVWVWLAGYVCLACSGR